MIEGNKPDRRLPRWPLTPDGTVLVVFLLLTLALIIWHH